MHHDYCGDVYCRATQPRVWKIRLRARTLLDHARKCLGTPAHASTSTERKKIHSAQPSRGKRRYRLQQASVVRPLANYCVMCWSRFFCPLTKPDFEFFVFFLRLLFPFLGLLPGFLGRLLRERGKEESCDGKKKSMHYSFVRSLVAARELTCRKTETRCVDLCHRCLGWWSLKDCWCFVVEVGEHATSLFGLVVPSVKV